MEADTLRLILNYCRDDLRLILDHPAEKLQKRKAPKHKAVIPTKEQFLSLVQEMRSPASQNKSQIAADLTEFMAYSGCRLAEATQVRWQDVDFERDVLLITGGDKGTKNHEQREIPLFAPLKRVFMKLKGNEGVPRGERIFKIDSAKKAISNACHRAELPHFTHHHFRHFFCSNAIEAGVDFKTIAEWLGHKDGGVLAAKTYGHLRAEHSTAMAKKITFDAAEKDF